MALAITVARMPIGDMAIWRYGDMDIYHSIQSVSKPIPWAYALDREGVDFTHQSAVHSQTLPVLSRKPKPLAGTRPLPGSGLTRTPAVTRPRQAA